MSFVEMVMKQRERELNPYIPPPRPQSRNGRASGLWHYIKVDPETGEDVESFTSASDAEERCASQPGATRVWRSSVNTAAQSELGTKSSGGWWWRRELKAVS